MNAPADTPLLLTRQTFVALTDETLVFLDLHNDNYSCLERRHTKSVAPLLGLPMPNNGGPGEIAGGQGTEDIARVVDDLITRGIATHDPKEGKRAEFVNQYGELKEILGYLPDERPQVRLSDVVRFFKALIVTKSLLKFASMERIVTRVRHRKERYHAKGGVRLDHEPIRELVEIYKILKPLVVNVKDQCLFNSLFLVEFLACYRAYPDWYFGVRLNGFNAHCWVQDRNVIYDDFIQNIGQNQPIMVA